MTDYESMTDQELNIAVAKRLGYTLVVDDKYGSPLKRWCLHLPSGELSKDSEGDEDCTECFDEDLAWARLTPNFTVDANEALALFADSVNFGLSKDTDRTWIAEEWDVDHSAVGRDKHPARATTICWLLWQDAIAP
jgi:hypothetical protein